MFTGVGASRQAAPATPRLIPTSPPFPFSCHRQVFEEGRFEARVPLTTRCVDARLLASRAAALRSDRHKGWKRGASVHADPRPARRCPSLCSLCAPRCFLAPLSSLLPALIIPPASAAPPPPSFPPPAAPAPRMLASCGSACARREAPRWERAQAPWCGGAWLHVRRWGAGGPHGGQEQV